MLSLWMAVPGCRAQDTSNAAVGRDFWVSVPLNSGTQTPRYYKLIALGDTPCSVTVTHLASGWTQTASLTANGYVYISLPENYARYTVLGVATENAFHVTSTADISLCAVDNQLASCGITQVLATPSLRNHYMVQDYPGNANHSSQSSSMVVLVAVEDSTMLSMLLPCMAFGCPVGAGNTYTVQLSQGQTCQLSAPAPGSFSGMTVTGNKPFALFQGNSLAYIPANSSSGDYIMEQAVPTDFWGMDFLLVATPSRTMDDIVRVTSLEDSCQIALTDGSLHDTLQCGQTREFTLRFNTVKHLTATKPICVGIYQPCSDYYGENGDGTQLMIHPLNKGITRASFKPFESVRIHSHHLTIVTRNEYVGGMTLDGSSVASSFTVIDGTYSFARIQVDSTLHHLGNSLGTFQACVHGHGRVESYAYNLGAPMAPLPCDTIRLYDTVCLSQPYEEQGFRITALQTGIAGDYLFERSTV
ncbi:MAG: IgGFc-binding protein [Bacteroidales bacterium]|nr:IgGFc-binding protein [Bacteroidales bacterium]